MNENLWITQQLVDQRSAEREAQAAAHRLAKEVQHDRGNRPRRRFSGFRFGGRSAPAADARPVIHPSDDLITAPELAAAATTKPCP